MPLAALERAEHQDEQRLRAHVPLGAQRLPRPGRRRVRPRVDAARHHPDAVAPHADAHQRLTDPVRDGHDGVDRAVVEEADVGAARGDVVHASGRHQAHAGAAAEGGQRVGARRVKVDHLGVADRTPEPQCGRHVEMIRDRQRQKFPRLEAGAAEVPAVGGDEQALGSRRVSD